MKFQSTSDEAYFDRNQAAQLAAWLAGDRGWPVWIGEDPDEPDWPVLFIELPTGQVSWHLPKDELIADTFNVSNGNWDGHSVEEKRDRIRTLIATR